MSRYIDAADVVKRYEELVNEVENGSGHYSTGNEAVASLKDLLDDCPTADVEEITRCGACAFCEIRNNDEPICHKHYMVVDNDYYCADGAKGEWMP